VQVVPAARAGPGLPALLGLIAPEDPLAVATRAVGVFSVGRVARAPQVLKAGGIVRKLGKKLGDRVVR